MNNQFYYHSSASLNENDRRGECNNTHPILTHLNHPYCSNQSSRRPQYQRRKQQDFVHYCPMYVDNEATDLINRMKLSDKEFEQRYFKSSFLENPWRVLELTTKKMM